MDTPAIVHWAHCDLDDYEGSCKYGEEDCPVLAAKPVEKKFVATEREYWTVGELRLLWNDLQRKALYVNSGVGEFSAAERFVYRMLKDIRHKFEETPQEDIVDTGYDFAEMNKDG